MKKEITITKAQLTQFNIMLGALRTIAKGYMTPTQLRRDSKKMYGLDYEEILEMSYENIQAAAAFACKGVKELVVQVPNSDKNPERSVATEDASSNSLDQQKNLDHE